MFRGWSGWEEPCKHKTNMSEMIMTDFALANSDFPTCAVHLRNMPKFVKQELVGPKAQYLIHMHMFLQMSIGYLMIFACLVFPEPGRTTLPGTAQWPFPGIESSSGGQSKVEGACRCCAYWDWHRNPVLVVVLQEAIMKYFDDNQMHSKYEDFRDWMWIKRSTIRYASSCALTTLGYMCKIQCSCKQDIYQLQVDKVMQLYETMLTRFRNGYSWEFPTCSN